VYFCLSEAKGKNTEPGSRKFSVRKIICDHTNFECEAHNPQRSQ